MKLHKVLAINGAPIRLIKEDVRLDATSPGRANFTVQSPVQLKGLVTLDIGYVERCTAANAVEQVLFCRELAAVLANPLPLNLRHVDLRDVLAEVSEQTGLRFRVPDRLYACVKAPYFYSLAAGYQAMDSLARVFSIPDFTWHQLGSGEVFAGSWADSFFGARAPLQIPTELFDGYQGNQSAMIAALPGGGGATRCNDQQRRARHTVALTNDQMAIRWTTQSAAL